MFKSSSASSSLDTNSLLGFPSYVFGGVLFDPVHVIFTLFASGKLKVLRDPNSCLRVNDSLNGDVFFAFSDCFE